MIPAARCVVSSIDPGLLLPPLDVPGLFYEQFISFFTARRCARPLLRTADGHLGPVPLRLQRKRVVACRGVSLNTARAGGRYGIHTSPQPSPPSRERELTLAPPV